MSDETTNREPKFWGINGPERLSATDPDEAIEEYLDDISPEEDTPKTITVYGYVPMQATLDPTRYLENILEALDEEYGDADGDGTTPTDNMKLAMQICCDAILKEYRSWACEQVCSQKIDVQAWIKEHRPDWLGEAKS